MGARCSGKSSLAAMLADKLGCEIVIRDEEVFFLLQIYYSNLLFQKNQRFSR